MPDAPTPDEAAAAPYGDEVLWHIRSLREHGYTTAAQHVQAMASHRAAHGQAVEGALRAERDALRAELEQAREVTQRQDGVLQSAFAREAAVRPVLDAVAAMADRTRGDERGTELWKNWPELALSLNNLWHAVAAYRSAQATPPAAVVSPDAGQPADGATQPDRLPPAISPDGEHVDHDCPFRRMLRDIAGWCGVEQCADGLFDIDMAQIEDLLRRALAEAGAPAQPDDDLPAEMLTLARDIHEANGDPHLSTLSHVMAALGMRVEITMTRDPDAPCAPPEDDEDDDAALAGAADTEQPT